MLNEAIRLAQRRRAGNSSSSRRTLSAYGADLRYRADEMGQPRDPEAASSISRASSARLGTWVRLHYVYPYPHVDDVIPLMAEGKVLPYLDVPFQHGSPGS